jgi:hypothetical protein
MPLYKSFQLGKNNHYTLIIFKEKEQRVSLSTGIFPKTFTIEDAASCDFQEEKLMWQISTAQFCARHFRFKAAAVCGSSSKRERRGIIKMQIPTTSRTSLLGPRRAREQVKVDECGIF